MKNSQEKPLVSVIVTTFNRKELLAKTIHSILSQTYKNFELVVIDNLSNYDFFSHIKSFGDDRIVAFQNQNSGIIAVNRNFGIKKAKGEYIAFCDDDDLWHPNKIEEQLMHFDKNIVAVSTNAILFGPEKKRLKHPVLSKDIFLGPDCDIGLLKSTIFSSLIIRNVGMLFEERVSFKFAEDFAFKVKLIHETQGGIKLLAQPLTYYRFDSGNKFAKLRSAKNSLNVIREYSGMFSADRFKVAYRKCLLQVAWVGLKTHSPESKRYYLEALKHTNLLGKPKICLMGFISTLPPKAQEITLNMSRKMRHAIQGIKL